MPDEYNEYIGDGVYASFDGYHIWLRTQQGMEIALEPPVFQRLTAYGARLKQLIKEKQND